MTNYDMIQESAGAAPCRGDEECCSIIVMCIISVIMFMIIKISIIAIISISRAQPEGGYQDVSSANTANTAKRSRPEVRWADR